MADITMPQLGETVTEGTITRWLKAVGDSVAEDEVLFEVSTDKVDSEVPSPAAGVVAEILVQEGETVDVGTRLAVISDGSAAPSPTPEAAASEAAASDQGPQTEGSVPAPSAEVVEAVSSNGSGLESSNGAASANGAGGEAAAASSAPAPATASGEAAGSLAPRTGAGEQRNASSTRPGDDRPASRPDEGGRVLSPVVRRLIAEYSLDIGEIVGTGAGGRITRSDVLDLIDRRQSGQEASAPGEAASKPAPSSADRGAGMRAAEAVAAAPSKAPAGSTLPVTERDTIVPFTNIRRRTAEHMVRSKQTSAHTLVAVEVDYSAVEAARSIEKDRFKQTEGFSLTYLPFIARAVVDALAEFPHVNASVGDDALIVHRDINLGIAVDLNFEGLLVPVVHQADGKRLRGLARDISALSGKARSKKLTMDDISGGTITITNAGSFGTLITVPVINQPQVAIISTDGVRKKPVAVELPDGSDGIAIHPIGVIAMSWDHRAFDGAYAAAFVAAVKHSLETRDWAGEL